MRLRNLYALLSLAGLTPALLWMGAGCDRSGDDEQNLSSTHPGTPSVTTTLAPEWDPSLTMPPYSLTDAGDISCKPRDVSSLNLFSLSTGGAAFTPAEVSSLEEALEKGLRLAEQSLGPLMADLPPFESVISEQGPRVGAIPSSGAAG